MDNAVAIAKDKGKLQGNVAIITGAAWLRAMWST